MPLTSNFNSTAQAILRTLIYSDIFDFPLTKNELWEFLICDDKIKRERFEEALKNLLGQKTQFSEIFYKDGQYCLTGREDIIEARKKNKTEAQKKLRIAKKAAYYLSFVPTVKFIGVSGGLALGSAEKNDDIDFFIITKKDTLFMTRFWVLVILEILNLRRKAGEKNAADKICVNLLIDERKLSWSKTERDIYVAHEIIQALPLFERNGMYEKFLQSNTWIKRYFTNFKKRQFSEIEKNQVNYFTIKVIGFFIFLWPFEFLMFNLQKYYMKRHKTTEIVLNNFLALHPNNYRTKTIEILSSKCENFGLLTNF